jgi:hypothetical protein
MRCGVLTPETAEPEDMARRRQPPKRSWKLPLAAACTVAAAVVLYLVFGGYVYRTTQGASIGLYATIGMLFSGFCLAGSALWLSARAVAERHAAIRDIKVIGKPDPGERRKAA